MNRALGQNVVLPGGSTTFIAETAAINEQYVRRMMRQASKIAPAVREATTKTSIFCVDTASKIPAAIAGVTLSVWWMSVIIQFEI